MDKIKYTLEFDMKSVPVMLLWTYISSPSGLEQWFADKVEHEGKRMTFFWGSVPTEAVQVSVRTGVSVRFRWADDSSKSYFEMKIIVSELTDDTILAVTDFAEVEDLSDSKELWTNQVDALKRMLGC